jgi:SET domain-containing protein
MKRISGRIIQNGEELTLDYGEDYWKGNRPMDTVHAPQAEQQLRRAE